MKTYMPCDKGKNADCGHCDVGAERQTKRSVHTKEGLSVSVQQIQVMPVCNVQITLSVQKKPVESCLFNLSSGIKITL